ncbi:peptidylprolyl isomerase [Horticoccus luteus]|uniref:peptidylprolyl isomerase n=1 Tax=Horticoccus luteus TaxID=2862869 RepID=A0A8F9TUP5_9BACT|nr:peptidylprolyl isomerase [Horticoccus luteus]QYM78336.1 peptidylprolyl isomerase [Horticoccus luteus]
MSPSIMTFLRLTSVLAALLLTATLRAQAPALAVTQPVPAQTAPVPTTLNLTSYFGYSGVTGTIVQFDTDLGKFNVELLYNAAPLSVANFLNYVSNSSYNDTIFHRSAKLSGTGNQILQGGGYTYAIPPDFVVHKPAIPLEYNLPNARGTIAFARTSDPNSATSEWFINVNDNTTVLGASNGGGYAVFGRVIGGGMTVVDALAAVPVYDLTGGNAANPFSSLPLQNLSTSAVNLENLIHVRSVAVVPLYPTAGSSASVLGFSAVSANPALLSVGLSGSTLTMTPGAGSGFTTVTVTATDAEGASVQTTFNVTVGPQVPAITTQPTSVTVPTGMATVLRVSALGAPLNYQWKKDGTAITGETRSSLVVNTAGSYTVTVQNGAGSVTSDAAVVTAVTSTNPGRLSNLSIRTDAGTADQTLIVGFVVGGTGTSGSKALLLRGVGPTLGGLGVASFLPDPTLNVYASGSSSVVATNNNWGGDVNVTAVGTAVGAFPLASAISKDAALVFNTTGGVYTAQVVGAGVSTGVALAEIYDATPPGDYTLSTPRLTNASARAQVGLGEHVLIAGFVVTGDTARTLLIRGLGPTLTSLGVTNALANPRLDLFNSSGDTVASNDDWAGDVTIKNVSATIGATALVSDSSQDAVLLVTLPPGVYTAQVSGVGATTGVALAEVYEVQ